MRAGTQAYASGSVVASSQFDDKVGVRLSAGGFRSRDYAPGPLSSFD
jgi:hypothetical protein